MHRIFAFYVPRGCLTCLLLLMSVTALPQSLSVSLMNVPIISQKQNLGEDSHGLLPDLLEAMTNKAGLELNIAFMPPKRAYQMFEDKGIPFTIVSEEQFEDPGTEGIGVLPLYRSSFYFYYLKDRYPQGLLFEQLHELKGSSIRAHRGAPTVQILREAGLEVDLYDDPVSGFQMLYKGRMDLLEVDYLAAERILGTRLQEMEGALARSSKTSVSFTVGLAFKLDNQDSVKIIEQLRIALTDLKNEGGYRAIFEAYWGQDIPDDILIGSEND